MGGAEGADRVKRKGRAAMDEAMHVVKESMTDTGGIGYFHVSPFIFLKALLLHAFLYAIQGQRLIPPMVIKSKTTPTGRKKRAVYWSKFLEEGFPAA